MKIESSKELRRRGAIKVLGGAGVVAFIGCGGGGKSTSTTSSGSRTSGALSCVLTPEDIYNYAAQVALQTATSGGGHSGSLTLGVQL